MNTTVENGESKSVVLVEKEQNATTKEESVIAQTEAVDRPAKAETIVVTATVTNEVAKISVPVLESDSKTITEKSEKEYWQGEELETKKKEISQVEVTDIIQKKAEPTEIQTLEIVKPVVTEMKQLKKGM